MSAGIPIQAERRRSILAPALACLGSQARWAIQNQFSGGGAIAILTALVEILVARQLWLALYQGKDSYQGVSLEQTTTYVALSLILTSLLKDDGYIFYKIRSGNIFFDLMYPLDLGAQMLGFNAGSVLAQLVFTGLPLLGLSAFLFHIRLDAGPDAWLAFALSSALGFLIYHAFNYLVILLGFWTTEIRGLTMAKNLIVAFLSGAVIPPWVFPAWAEKLLLWLPFQGINYTPMAILVGRIGPGEYALSLAIQAAWALALWAAGRGLFGLALRHLGIQGG